MIFRNPFKPYLALTFLFLLLLWVPSGCSNDTTAPPEDDPSGDPAGIHEDEGNLGLILDTRPIFKHGYQPLTADFSFSTHSRHDITLNIDQTTNLAILSLHLSDLTEEEAADFQTGTPMTITIHGPDKAVLATLQDDQLVLDDSNRKLPVTTSLPYVAQPVILEDDLPYLIQMEGRDNVMAQTDLFYYDPDNSYVLDERSQQFFFTPVLGAEGIYTVSNIYYGDTLFWISNQATEVWIGLDHDVVGSPVELVLEQDEDGWMRMRVNGTSDYLVLGNHYYQGTQNMELTSTDATRFRLICDNINWKVMDRGTTFQQPVMPSAQVDFAYQNEIINCGSGSNTSTIGTTKSKTYTETYGVEDSFQLFSSETITYGIEIGVSVSASVGIEVSGVGEASTEVELSSTFSYECEAKNSTTRTSTNNWSKGVERSKQVSYTESYVTPAYSVIKIRDVVKIIKDIRVPFTQVLRVTGSSKDGGRDLTGEEIRSQMLFNFVGGVIKTVGADYVDIGLRGYSIIDEMFHMTRLIEEVEDGCGE